MKQPIALVLSGGAARGIAHIGIIEELEKNNFEIKSVAGNSMGAFVGAIYASGQLPEFKEWILNLGKKDLIKLADITISKNGFVKGEKLFTKLKEFLPDVNIEDLSIPYTAVAADLTNMQEVVLSTGSLQQAVRASIAIPGVFMPVYIGNSVLVDGGVVNPIPLNRVKRTNGDMLVASFVNAKHPEPPENHREVAQNNTDNSGEQDNKPNKEGLFTIMSKTTSLLTYSLAMTNIEKYNPDILFNVSRDSCGTFEFHRIEEMIENGKKAAQKGLADFEDNMIICS
ncbi:patatin-like phospholipase family protein [Roseimarinus sediminis]|uniref:patatin-like phospholipase family protein n=1 Tax=Roseimarinus sediminis TaxID=1610899 RepID=UPI003D1AEB78